MPILLLAPVLWCLALPISFITYLPCPYATHLLNLPAGMAAFTLTLHLPFCTSMPDLSLILHPYYYEYLYLSTLLYQSGLAYSVLFYRPTYPLSLPVCAPGFPSILFLPSCASMFGLSLALCLFYCWYLYFGAFPLLLPLPAYEL